jgi:signal transduction histidine kinase
MSVGFSLPSDGLDDLARVAGPLVHELKNPIGAVLMNAELLRGDLGAIPAADRDRFARRLARIEDSARALQLTVQSFLAFARPVRSEPAAIDLNRELERLLDDEDEALRGAGIEVVFHPDRALCLVPGDRGHVRSIFANILANARDALRERDAGRRLIVLTRRAQGASRVVIANNGPPLPEVVAARLFEPFVSSKEEGTGLGLAIVRQLMALHGGTISATSDPEQGVSFTCEFPTPLGPSLTQGELPPPTSDPAPGRKRPRRGART